MTDHDDTHANISDRLTDIEQALRERHMLGLAPTTPPTPQFAVGDAVLVWATGLRAHIVTGPETKCLRCRIMPDSPDAKDSEPFMVDSDQLLSIPQAPDSTEEYDVGEWARPVKGTHEGWLDSNLVAEHFDPFPYWFDGRPNSGCIAQDIDHGYRFPLTRVAKPKFEVGQCVKITHNGEMVSAGIIKEVKRDAGAWQYLVRIPNGSHELERETNLESLPDAARKFQKGQRVKWYDETVTIRSWQQVGPADDREWMYRLLRENGAELDMLEGYLEPLSETDTASRQPPPDSPPKFYGREMRWKRDRDGNILYRGPLCDEHYLLRGEIAVWQYAHASSHASHICEPVPVVKGWDEKHLWLAIRNGRIANVILAGNSHLCPKDRISIPAKDFPLPSIPIPESNNE